MEENHEFSFVCVGLEFPPDSGIGSEWATWKQFLWPEGWMEHADWPPHGLSTGEEESS